MDKIVDHLFVFKGDGEVQDFPGNYSDYRSYEDSLPPEDKPKEQPTPKSVITNTAEKLSYNEQKELNNLESKIRKLELDKKALEAEFNDITLSQEKINELSMQLQHVINDIAAKEARWFELSEKLES